MTELIKGAIFDMDGTLLDSMALWDRMGEDYLRSIGYEPREGVNGEFKSRSLLDAALYFRSEYGVTLPAERIVGDINAIAQDFYSNKARAKPGVIEFLSGLGERGVKMCVATSTDRHLVELSLKKCGLDRFFTRIFTCTEVGKGKSEPDVYREAMRFMGTEKSDTVVFEDALFAAVTAKNDGFPVAGVRDRFQPFQDKLEELSDYYITDFYEACSMFE